MKRATEVSEVQEPSGSASVEGILTELSPMKRSKRCSYFDGEISDEKKSMRFFGFDSSVRRKLIEYEEKKSPVVLSNCEAKLSAKNAELELLLTKRTEVEPSKKNFDVDDINERKLGCLEKLAAIDSLILFQRVSVEVKVVKVEDAMEVGNGKKKQDILVADDSATKLVTVWEEDTGKMEEGLCYRLSSMLVKEYKGKRFLSTSKQSSIIQPISDIGNVVQDEGEEGGQDTDNIKEDNQQKSTNVRVVGVLHLETYKSCLKCTGKVKPLLDDEEISMCLKCGMMQCYLDAMPKQSANLLMKTTDGTMLSLQVFGKHIHDIAESNRLGCEVTPSMLLKASPFSVTHHHGIIQAVKRKPTAQLP